MGRGRGGEAGCGRFVGPGRTRCAEHGEEEWPTETEPTERPGEAFRRRLAEGEYRALFDPAVAEVIAQAGRERDLADVIGMLRLALARLVTEEQDAAKLAGGVARVSGVLVQAARAQRALVGDESDELQRALTRALIELDGE